MSYAIKNAGWMRISAVLKMAFGARSEILNLRKTRSDPAAYDAQAKRLADLFRENFVQFQDQTPKEVSKAGPRMR